MTTDLFTDDTPQTGGTRLGPQAQVLRGFALPWVDALWPALQAMVAQAPWRHMQTPGGQRMSVALTNCGALGWVSDRRGYRYSALDPDSGQPWPALPTPFADLATQVAAAAGFSAFTPDACLINRYAPGARMGLHQDRDERDLAQPNLPAIVDRWAIEAGRYVGNRLKKQGFLSTQKRRRPGDRARLFCRNNPFSLLKHHASAGKQRIETGFLDDKQ